MSISSDSLFTKNKKSNGPQLHFNYTSRQRNEQKKAPKKQMSIIREEDLTQLSLSPPTRVTPSPITTINPPEISIDPPNVSVYTSNDYQKSSGSSRNDASVPYNSYNPYSTNSTNSTSYTTGQSTYSSSLYGTSSPRVDYYKESSRNSPTTYQSSSTLGGYSNPYASSSNIEKNLYTNYNSSPNANYSKPIETSYTRNLYEPSYSPNQQSLYRTNTYSTLNYTPRQDLQTTEDRYYPRPYSQLSCYSAYDLPSSPVRPAEPEVAPKKEEEPKTESFASKITSFFRRAEKPVETTAEKVEEKVEEEIPKTLGTKNIDVTSKIAYTEPPKPAYQPVTLQKRPKTLNIGYSDIQRKEIEEANEIYRQTIRKENEQVKKQMENIKVNNNPSPPQPAGSDDDEVDKFVDRIKKQIAASKNELGALAGRQNSATSATNLTSATHNENIHQEQQNIIQIDDSSSENVPVKEKEEEGDGKIENYDESSITAPLEVVDNNTEFHKAENVLEEAANNGEDIEKAAEIAESATSATNLTSATHNENDHQEEQNFIQINDSSSENVPVKEKEEERDGKIENYDESSITAPLEVVDNECEVHKSENVLEEAKNAETPTKESEETERSEEENEKSVEIEEEITDVVGNEIEIHKAENVLEEAEIAETPTMENGEAERSEEEIEKAVEIKEEITEVVDNESDFDKAENVLEEAANNGEDIENAAEIAEMENEEIEEEFENSYDSDTEFGIEFEAAMLLNEVIKSIVGDDLDAYFNQKIQKEQENSEESEANVENSKELEVEYSSMVTNSYESVDSENSKGNDDAYIAYYVETDIAIPGIDDSPEIETFVDSFVDSIFSELDPADLKPSIADDLYLSQEAIDEIGISDSARNFFSTQNSVDSS